MHFQSHQWFGWPLGQATSIETMAKLALKSIDYLSPSANCQEFLKAIEKADQALNNGVNINVFKEKITARGMDSIYQGTAKCQ